MAITVNFNGASLRKPGGYTRSTVDLTGGFPVAPTGIVGIVGEAEAGAPGSAEDIKTNFFSPDQVQEMTDKYKSGQLVDAFRQLTAPSNDARVANGAQRIFVYKTNASTQASATLDAAYGTVLSQNYGSGENLINYLVSDSQDEAGPALATMGYIVDDDTAGALFARANGGAKQTAALSAGIKPDAVVTAVDAFTDIAAAGGTNRASIDAGRVADGTTLGVTVTAGVGLFTIGATTPTWAVTPTVGDTLYIPTGSVVAGGGSENIGGWLVTAVTTSTITAVKLGDPSTSAVTVAPADIAATTDLEAFAPVTISYDGTTPTGVGAALEIGDDAGTVALEEFFYGGTDRGVLTSIQVDDGSTLALSAAAAVITVTVSTAFAASPTVGDTLWIRPGSILAGGSDENVGSYRVSASTATTITATKFSGTPTDVTAADIAATTDLEVFKGVFTSTTTPILNTSSSEAKVTIEVNRQSDNLTENSTSLGGNVALSIGYDGTTATVKITSLELTTTVTGGSGANLTIKLADYATLNDLATFITAQTGYTASVGTALFGQFAPSTLDRVTDVGCATEIADGEPGRIKKDSQEVQDFFDASSLVELTRTAFAGLPTSSTTRVFLSGGTKGGTTAASASAGIDAFQKVRVNSIVPLFSRDAIDDILDGDTEPSSTYQIDAINTAAKSHCLLMSNTKNRNERNAYVSYKGTLTDTETKSQNLASERVSFALQDVKILKTDGTLDWVQPWGMAATAAGMQAGANVGEPMTFKFINVSGIRHEDFDPATQFDEAIDNGLLFAESPDDGGFRVVVGNTTYGKDPNFVFNRISVLYAADTVAFNFRKQLEDIFVGVGAAIASAPSIKNTSVAILGSFKAAGLIVGDDTNNGSGFKNLSVRLVGNTAFISVTITPVQGIDFLLIDIVLDNIRQTA
jgi:hypothetical protein